MISIFTITVRISADKLAQIDRMAAQFSMSRNEFINQCIDYAMEHIGSEKSAQE